MKNSEYLFREMPVPKAIFSLAIPTVISQIITVIYNMADTFFIGQMNDPDQMAAVTVSMPLFIALTGFANLFGIGGASRISRCLGVNDKKGARHTCAFSIWSALGIALIYAVALLPFEEPLLILLGADENTLSYCQSYIFWTITIGGIPTVLNQVFAHLVRTEGYSKPAAFGIALGGILNMILDPIFIFLFDLEIMGAAIATMLSNAAATVFFIIFIFRLRRNSVLTLSPKSYRAGEKIASEVIVGGLPSFITMMLGCVSNGILNSLVSDYSNTAIAGMGIAKKIDMIAFCVAQGMTQGVLPLIAYNYSSGNRQRMMNTIKLTLTINLIMAGVTTLGLFVLAEPITACFIADAETVRHGAEFLRIICFICPSTAINFMVITVFQATKQKYQPVILSFLRKGSTDIPLMFLLNNIWGMQGIAAATPVADWLALFISGTMFFMFVKKLKKEQRA